MIEYEDAPPAVRAVYDDIMRTRKTDWINNFWKVLANHPATLKRTWESVKEVMAPGALDPLTKELIYIAVSASNACEYCVRSHTFGARAKGMNEAMLGELMAVVGMANETNALANGYQVEVDERFMATGGTAAVVRLQPRPRRPAGRKPAGPGQRGRGGRPGRA
jgi:AhpD family alkylhydroperoxidase